MLPVFQENKDCFWGLLPAGPVAWTQEQWTRYMIKGVTRTLDKIPEYPKGVSAFKDIVQGILRCLFKTGKLQKWQWASKK